MAEGGRYSGPVRVRGVEGVAPDAVVVSVEAPAVAAAAAAGQFVMVRFPGRVEPLLSRPFSVYDADGEALLLLIRTVGPVTRRLAEVAPGEVLHLVGPLGRGFDLDVAQPPSAASAGEEGPRPGAAALPAGRQGPPVRHILVGGGMGVAPLPMLVKALRRRGDADLRVLVGACNRDGLYTLGRLAPERQTTITEDGSSGRAGLVTDLLVEALEPGDGPAAVYACGPEAMLAAVAALCRERGVPCQVSLEAMMACGTGLCHGCAVRLADGGYALVCRDGPVFNAADLAIPWSR